MVYFRIVTIINYYSFSKLRIESGKRPVSVRDGLVAPATYEDGNAVYEGPEFGNDAGSNGGSKCVGTAFWVTSGMV